MPNLNLMLTWRQTPISSSDCRNCVTYLQPIQTRQLSKFPILLFSGCILPCWIGFAFNSADDFHWKFDKSSIDSMSLYWSFQAHCCNLQAISNSSTKNRHWFRASWSTVFTDLTAKCFFLLLVPVVVVRNQSGFWQHIWKEKRKVKQLMHNKGKGS